MSIFNLKRKRNQKVRNKASGEAFRQDPRVALASLLLTSFAEDQFYRKGKQTFKELEALLKEVDPQFAAKAAVFTRREYGMRSITHVMAGQLAALASGQEWAKGFYEKIVRRPDDMLEIMAYYQSLGNKHLTNAMKKGFAKAFDHFDDYQLAKYRRENKAIRLVDMVNLVHPVPTQRNAKALQLLVDGKLKSQNTWENKLTQAGQKAENASDKKQKKAEAWTELIRSNKLGYFALLRNLRNIAEQAPDVLGMLRKLRNIAEQAPDVLGDALGILTDRSRIKKSLVLPFRFMTAQQAIVDAQLPIKRKRSIQKALNKALELSIDNVPVFPGRTLVILDDSGSMTWGKKQMGKTPIQIGAIFAAMLYKSNEADLMRFSDSAAYVYPYYADAAGSIAERLIKQARSGGTNFHSIFQKANKAYDRIIILSDMQGWIGAHAPVQAFADYCKNYNADPFVYSFDLQGYGSSQLTGGKVFQLAGFSDKIFDLMGLLETNRNALVNKIDAVEL